MKRLTLILTCLVVGALCAALPARAAEKTVIHLLSTPFGTGSYVLGTALESIVNQGNYPLSIAHAETPGPVSYTHLTLPTILLV